jgi:hypothetical protein
VAEVMSKMLGERFIASTFDSYTTNPGGGPEREPSSSDFGGSPNVYQKVCSPLKPELSDHKQRFN